MKRALSVVAVAILLLGIAGASTALAPPNAKMTSGGDAMGTMADGTEAMVSFDGALSCEETQMPASLEVDWGDNTFMLEAVVEGMTSCSGDPTESPMTDFNMLEGEGTGMLNGDPDYHVIYSFADYDEPATMDMVGIEIHDPQGNTVLSVPEAVIDEGNIQAHGQIMTPTM